MSDAISRMLADGWVEKYGTAPKQETADELATRLVREARSKALDRALGDLSQGYEPRQTDLDLFNGDPHLNLRYHDARDEALARYGDELEWRPPAPEPEEEDGSGE